MPIANSGLGWCYLAGVGPDERAAVIAQIETEDASRWQAARGPFFRALAEFEEHGFIVNSRVFHPDYHTVAVPVYDKHGRFHCGVNCGGPLSTLPERTMREQVAPKLLALARMLQAGMVLE